MMTNTETFPIQNEYIYLGHCGISPLYSGARERMKSLIDFHADQGDALFQDHYIQELDRFKELMGRYIHTAPENIAAMKNTTEALSMIANGYPFEHGDELILYEHEYPANFYPWINLKHKGVKIRTLPNKPHDQMPEGLPGSWSWEALEDRVTDRTRMIVMSHVQFVSGYAADLDRLSELCQDRDIDLIVDAAQSLGALPIDVEQTPVSALAASGWKWMMGPVGIAPFYTSPAMREKIDLTIIGAETMKQGTDFLDHTWAPHDTARRYEYATSPIYQVAGLNQCVEELFLKHDPQKIYQKLIGLQDAFLGYLSHEDFRPLIWPDKHRSGILSVYHPAPEVVAGYLKDTHIVVSARGGYLRLAPHFYNTEKEMKMVAIKMNEFTIQP